MAGSSKINRIPAVRHPFSLVSPTIFLSLTTTMVNLEWNHFDPIPPMELGARIAAEKFYRDLREAFPDYAADFEQKFAEWQGKWFDPESPGASRYHNLAVQEQH
jgi:hypothetical protein